MTVFKSRRRRKAEEVVGRAYRLRDDVLDGIERGQRRIRSNAKRSAKALKRDAKHLKAATKRDVRRAKIVAERNARLGRRETVRVAGNIEQMVRDNPGATLGGALALAVAIGASATFWAKRD